MRGAEHVAIWETREMHTEFWCGKLREGNYLEDPDVDGRIIIIIISNLSSDRSKASCKTVPPHSAI